MNEARTVKSHSYPAAADITIVNDGINVDCLFWGEAQIVNVHINVITSIYVKPIVSSVCPSAREVAFDRVWHLLVGHLRWIATLTRAVNFDGIGEDANVVRSCSASALCAAAVTPGTASSASMPMTVVTTISSTSENPLGCLACI